MRAKCSNFFRTACGRGIASPRLTFGAIFKRSWWLLSFITLWLCLPIRILSLHTIYTLIYSYISNLNKVNLLINTLARPVRAQTDTVEFRCPSAC